MNKFALACAALMAMASAIAVAVPEATYSVKLLTPETALRAAQAAMDKCRKDGFQVAVAVVDRAGVTQVMLRDRLAGAHTPDTAINKAWTAASFRMSTLELAKETEAGKSMSGIRQIPRIAAIGGGLVISGNGASLGAIAVSGAPGGAADEACAAAGIKAIQDDIDF